MTATPEFALNDLESEKLGALAANVERHFSIMPESEVVRDILALASGLGLVAFGHFAAYQARKMNEKRSAEAPPMQFAA